MVRNRIKRRLRDVFRRHRARMGAQWDIVLNPRRAALTYLALPSTSPAHATIGFSAKLARWTALREMLEEAAG